MIRWAVLAIGLIATVLVGCDRATAEDYVICCSAHDGQACWKEKAESCSVAPCNPLDCLPETTFCGHSGCNVPLDVVNHWVICNCYRDLVTPPIVEVDKSQTYIMTNCNDHTNWNCYKQWGTAKEAPTKSSPAPKEITVIVNGDRHVYALTDKDPGVFFSFKWKGSDLVKTENSSVDADYCAIKIKTFVKDPAVEWAKCER